MDVIVIKQLTNDFLPSSSSFFHYFSLFSIIFSLLIPMKRPWSNMSDIFWKNHEKWQFLWLKTLEKSFLMTTNCVHFYNGTANGNILSLLLLTNSLTTICEVILISQGSWKRYFWGQLIITPTLGCYLKVDNICFKAYL